MKGHFVLGLEDTRYIAVMYASQEILEGKLTDPKESIEKINKVDLDDVVRVARLYLDTKSLSLALIGPFEDKDRFEKLLKS